MTMPRPGRTQISRVSVFVGLLVAALLVLLPAVHHHKAMTKGPPAGQAERQCTLCVVYSGVETPDSGPASTYLHVFSSAPAAADAPCLSLTPESGVNLRAPPTHSA